MAVSLLTNYGTIKIALDTDRTPKTVENFLSYVRAGFYDNTIFHRVISNFMIQGGGFEPGMIQKPTEAPIENEAPEAQPNETYTIAMARTAAPHSATCQFFINVNDNYFLDFPGQDGWGYCVFGRVVEGQDVVDRIKNVATTRVGMHDDVPVQDVLIKKAEEVAD